MSKIITIFDKTLIIKMISSVILEMVKRINQKIQKAEKKTISNIRLIQQEQAINKFKLVNKIRQKRFNRLIFYSIVTKQINQYLFHLQMEHKYRSFPPALPLKINKLLQYDYLHFIYHKYDSNFFRQILPYFSEIIITNKLELHKFIYFPIDNPHKLLNIQIGLPFKPDSELNNQSIHQIARQVTFIKIALQTHVIFQYLMNLSLTSIPLPRLKFQDKFWLFSEGVLKDFCFSDVVFRKDSRRQKGVTIFLEGEFICLNEQKKPFKTIGKGYLIDMDGNLKKVNYDDKIKTDRISFDESLLSPANKESQADIIKQQQYEQKVSAIWSHSNSTKVLYINYGVIKKYCQNFQDHSGKSSKSPVKKQKQFIVKKPLKPEFRSQFQFIYNNSTMKTQTEEQKSFVHMRKTFAYQCDSSNLQKKFNLISCRTNVPILSTNHVRQVFEDQVIKSYTKEKQLYQKMVRQLSIRKHQKFYSSDVVKAQSVDRKEQLMPFFRQELKDQKEKVILRRRKTKELWGQSSIHKQNFIMNAKKLVEEIGKEKNLNKNKLKSSKLMKKIDKNQLSAFKLIKRNLFNKEYHQLDFVKILS